MVPVKIKHIVIGLSIVLLLFLLFLWGNENYESDNSGPHPQGFIHSQPSYHKLESEQNFSNSTPCLNNNKSPTRHEILQYNIKGYREKTYWGSEHPINDKVRYMDNDEFDRFIEEVELNDADVYWGAEY